MTKKERVLAVMKKEQVDMIPAGFWFHYKSDYTVQQMIDEHMKLFRTTDMDIVKIMQDYPYPISGKITCADDWYHIQVKGTDSEEFAKMAEIIRGIRKEAGKDVLIFQTMFGPFKAASMTFGDDVLMKYSKEAPEAGQHARTGPRVERRRDPERRHARQADRPGARQPRDQARPDAGRPGQAAAVPGVRGHRQLGRRGIKINLNADHPIAFGLPGDALTQQIADHTRLPIQGRDPIAEPEFWHLERGRRQPLWLQAHRIPLLADMPLQQIEPLRLMQHRLRGWHRRRHHSHRCRC